MYFQTHLTLGIQRFGEFFKLWQRFRGEPPNIFCFLLFMIYLMLMLITKSCRLFVTPGTIARQAPLSMEFSRHEYQSVLPFSPLGDLPNPGIKPKSPASAGGFFTTQLPGNLMIYIYGLLEFHYNTCYYYSDFNVIILFLNLLFIKNNKKNVKNLVGLQDLCQRFLQIDTFC